jgi:hypothetical protein
VKAKELLKQQVWIVSEVVMESGHAAQTSKFAQICQADPACAGIMQAYVFCRRAKRC